VGKPLVWDVTVVIYLADSYVERVATGTGHIAEMVADRKLEQYANLLPSHTFQPIAVENLGTFSLSAVEFLSDLGRRLSFHSGEDRERSFLFQRLSVSIQRFNSVLFAQTICQRRYKLIGIQRV